MKHSKVVSRLPVRASESTIPATVILDFIVAVLVALKPLLEAAIKESTAT